MPRVAWGVSASDVDNFDRESQYAPYDGPIPTNGVYLWKIKKLQHIAPTGDKLPQLRIGLELIPRKGRREEKAYSGYFLMAFLPVSQRTQFRYVPFLDAIGVSGREFERGTVTDEEGNISKIGKWRNSGDEIIKAEIKDGEDQHGNSRKEIGWMGATTDDPDEDYDEDGEEFDDDDEDEDGEDEW
jgi:hypothetical protein